MDRRSFVTRTLAATTTVAFLKTTAGAGEGKRKKSAAAKASSATATSPPRNIASNLRTKIAVSPQWFDGTHVEQIEQIAGWGFRAFETLRCGTWEDKEAVRARCQELGVACGAVGGGMGTITEWGPNDPAYHQQFLDSVKEGIANAKAIGSKIVLALTGRARDAVSREEQMEALVKAGKLVGPLLQDAGITLVWECLNVLVNHPGYFLVYSADGAELVQRTGHPNVKFLYDIYHQQISEGNLINNIKKYANEIGHYHFADNPGRHEPTTGEINYKNVFKAIHETGYQGIVACEFGKLKSTEEVLEILVECDRWAD